MFEKSLDHGVSVEEEGGAFRSRGCDLGVRKRGVAAKNGKSKKKEKCWFEGHHKQKETMEGNSSYSLLSYPTDDSSVGQTYTEEYCVNDLLNCVK